MRKLTKKSLDELANLMPRISEIHQRSFIGGGDGTKSSPYTVNEVEHFLDNGYFPGGWVVIGSSGDVSYMEATSGCVVTEDKLTKPPLSTNFNWVHGYNNLSSLDSLASILLSQVPVISNIIDAEAIVNGWITDILSKANYNMGEEFGIYTDGMGDLCVCNQSGELIGKRNWYTTNIEMSGHYPTGDFISGDTY